MGRTSLENLPASQIEYSGHVQSGLWRILSPEYWRRTVLLVTAFFMTMLVFYFILSWTPAILQAAGLEAKYSVLGGTLLNVGGILGILTMGYLSAEYGLRRVLLSIFLLEAIFMALFAVTAGSEPIIAMAVVFFLGGCAHGGIVGLYATAAWIFPTALRATGLGWALGLGRSGAIVGPYLAGFLMALGWSRETYFFVLGLPLILAALALAVIQGDGLSAKQEKT
jgi:MFS family permease